MRVICSWCVQEGKIGCMGEKPPFDDLRETHGICATHYQEFQVQWEKSVEMFDETKRYCTTAACHAIHVALKRHVK